MQSNSSRIWTRVAVSITYDDNHYTTDTSIVIISFVMFFKGLVKGLHEKDYKNYKTWKNFQSPRQLKLVWNTWMEKKKING